MENKKIKTYAFALKNDISLVLVLNKLRRKKKGPLTANELMKKITAYHMGTKRGISLKIDCRLKHQY